MILTYHAFAKKIKDILFNLLINMLDSMSSDADIFPENVSKCFLNIINFKLQAVL